MFSWYKYLIVSLVFSHLGFWSGNLFLIAPFPDVCLLVLFFRQVYDKLEYHLRCLEELQKDTNNDMFLVIIKSKIPEDMFQQLELLTGAKNKWSVNKLRHSLNVLHMCF